MATESKRSMEGDLSLMLMTFLACWIIVMNVIVIVVLLRSKALRHRSYVIFLINIMCCFLVQSICGSPYYNMMWLADFMPIGCDLVRILTTFVKLLLNFSVLLLMVDVCVQLKSLPFHEMGAGRAVIMIACTWVLAICMTILLHVALPHIAPAPERLSDCMLKHSYEYDIIHYSISFIAPTSMLLIIIIITVILNRIRRYSKRLHYHTQTREVVNLITRANNRVLPSCICATIHLILLVSEGVALMRYIMMTSSDDTLLAVRVTKYVSYAGAAVLPLLWILLNQELRKHMMNSSESPY